MKRTMLIGPSQYGKTLFTQCMRGEASHCQKTQTIVWSPMTIDTPGEYLENRCLYSTLLASACKADIIVLILNADASWPPLSPGFTGPMSRPVIGLVTEADLASPQRIPPAESWLTQVGAQKVFVTSVLENTGVDEMFVFLDAKGPLCLTEQ